LLILKMNNHLRNLTSFFSWSILILDVHNF